MNHRKFLPASAAASNPPLHATVPTQTIATLRETLKKTDKQPPHLSGPEYAGSAELEAFRKTGLLLMLNWLISEKDNDT